MPTSSERKMLSRNEALKELNDLACILVHVCHVMLCISNKYLIIKISRNSIIGLHSRESSLGIICLIFLQ